MKKLNITYWIITGLLSAFIVLGAIMDIIMTPDAIAVFKHLGYPQYFMPLIGFLKVLGIITILVPGFPKIKEWAYAGLVFDTFGALYSHISSGDGPGVWSAALVALILIGVSYALYHKKLSGFSVSA